MAHIDLEHFDAKPRVAALNERERHVHRTQYMLYASAIASMIIVVVAALFLSLFI